MHRIKINFSRAVFALAASLIFCVGRPSLAQANITQSDPLVTRFYDHDPLQVVVTYDPDGHQIHALIIRACDASSKLDVNVTVPGQPPQSAQLMQGQLGHLTIPCIVGGAYSITIVLEATVNGVTKTTYLPLLVTCGQRDAGRHHHHYHQHHFRHFRQSRPKRPGS